MAIKIGTIAIDLIANTSSFQQGMDKAAQIALSSSRNIEKSFNLMGTAIVAATGAAIGALGMLIEKTNETVFSMQKMAQQSGTSIEQFSKLAYAAKLAGMPIDQMSVILTRISHSSFEAASGNKQAAAAYKMLGVSVQDSNGHFKTADQIALDLAKSLGQYKDSAAKTGIETMIMGRSGAQAASFLHLLATRFEETSTQAEKLGVVFGGPTAQAAAKLHESLIMIEEAGLGLSVKLLTAVSPALDEISQKIINLVSNTDNMKRMEAFGETLAAGIRLAGDALEFMVEHLTAIKFILGGLVGIRLVGMFGPMIASAVLAEGTMAKLGLAALNLTGNLLGVRKLGNLMGPLIANATEYSGALITLAREEGVAGAASIAFGDALAFAQSKMVITLGALGALAAGVGIFAMALNQNKSQAEEAGHIAVTWGDMWHGAINNVKEDFQDLGKIMQAVLTGDVVALTEMKWTSLPDAALKEARKRQQQNQSSQPGSSPATADKPLKDMGTLPATEKVDKLAQKLEEMRQRAMQAQRELALVGTTPQQQRDSEILEKYNLFLAEQKGLLDKLTPAKRALAEVEAHASIVTEVNVSAAAKYATELYELSQTLQTSTNEHLAMAAAVGKSAQAMQDAAIAAQVSQKMQKMGGANWQSDPKMVADSKKLGDQIRRDTNAGNLDSDNKSYANQQRELDAQNKINAAVLKGADAKKDAEVANAQAAIRQDFADRGDTNLASMQQQIDMVRQKSEAERQASDLEKAAGMSSTLRYQEQKKAIEDAATAARAYGVAIDYREVLQANKEAWMQFQEAQDKAILATGSMMDGLKVALNQMARDTQSSAQMMFDAMNQAIGALNDAIAKAMMVTGHNKGKQISNDFAGAFKGIGDSLAKKGLQKGESALLGKFGMGKPDGTSGNPLHVKVVGGLKGGGAGTTNELGDLIGGGSKGSSGGAASGLLGMLNDSNWASSLFGGKLFGSGSMFGGAAAGASGAGGMMSSLVSMLPMFADGGDMIPGMPSIVGEKGPELFLPPGGGSIVPNSQLKNGMGDTHHFHIDARGSNDPAQTVQLIHQYMQKAAPQMIAGSMKAMTEHKLRTAPSAGRA